MLGLKPMIGPDAARSAKWLIAENNIMTVASADETGKPWVSPVFYVPDDNFDFYWVSAKDALHSRNVRVRPEIAISIWGTMPDGVADGLYVDAVVAQLETAEEVDHGIAVMARRPQSSKFTIGSANDVMGNATWRIYKATPVQFFNRADAEVNGQAVTVRVPIDAALLAE